MKIFEKFKNLGESLKKTKQELSNKISSIFGAGKIDAADIEKIEEALVLSDISYKTAVELIESVKKRLAKNKDLTTDIIKQALKDEVGDKISVEFPEIKDGNDKNIFIIVGVNGVGKTTTVGKLGKYYADRGKKVIIAACDTFRAAGKEQIEVWGQRTGIEVVSGKENQDPASVAHDAVQKFKEQDYNILLIDTAGRLHNKKHLMEELAKIKRVISKSYGSEPDEIFIVIDAGLGQNSLVQVEQFKEIVNITGVIVTKLDGSAKGGIIIDIISRMNLPVRFIGTGESPDDISEFSPEIFKDNLL
ncbi:MAG: signal recognition particle-docking protein FtsY [Deltaproteobacteria bacterium]|jgi:signal recognition particle-docking protein FtsY|nr:signal recognition particle-docking protein FtsY [Deltaproteobacteria bacterium]MCL6120040.1 signal recognition particle-docking protein FtsY [Deltaproteobacteria bacterium]MDA8299916.1 signal recognition particle-docking protein FtsY [Deltaproteobacteria bacterium]